MPYFDEVSKKFGESKEQAGSFFDPERATRGDDPLGSAGQSLMGLLGMATAPARALAPRMAHDVAEMGAKPL